MRIVWCAIIFVIESADQLLEPRRSIENNVNTNRPNHRDKWHGIDDNQGKQREHAFGFGAQRRTPTLDRPRLRETGQALDEQVAISEKAGQYPLESRSGIAKRGVRRRSRCRQSTPLTLPSDFKATELAYR